MPKSIRFTPFNLTGNLSLADALVRTAIVLLAFLCVYLVYTACTLS